MPGQKQLSHPLRWSLVCMRTGSLGHALPDYLVPMRSDVTLDGVRRRALVLGLVGLTLIVATAVLTAPAASPAPFVVALRAPAGDDATGLAGLAFRTAWVTLASMDQVYPLVGESVDSVAVADLPATVGADTVVFFNTTDSDVRMVTRQGVLSIPLFLSAASTSDAVAAELQRALGRPASGVDTTTEAWRRYVKVLEAQERGDILPYLLDELAEVRRMAPKWAPPYATEASLSAYLYRTTSDPAYLERAHRLIVLARTLSGGAATLTANIEVAIAMGDAEAAQQCLDELRSRHPTHPFTALYTARVLHFLHGRTEEAIQELASIENPTVADLAFLGNLEFTAGKVEDARFHLRQSIAKSSSSWRQMSQLAAIELVYGDPGQAEQLFETLMTQAPSAMYLSNLGTALYLQRRYSEAVGCYRQAMQSGLRSPVVEANLGDALLGLGKRAEARSHFQAAVEGWRRKTLEAEEEAMLAYVLARVDQVDSAREVIGRALAAAPESPIVHWCAWSIALATGDRAGASEQRSKAEAYGLSQWWFVPPSSPAEAEAAAWDR